MLLPLAYAPAGSRSTNVLPIPSALVAVRLPPITSANPREIASPNPAPSLGEFSARPSWVNGEKM